MIPVAYSKPLLQSGPCLVADYDQAWLEDLLREAARKAHSPMPCISEVAEGIIIYLREECPLRSLPLEYFFARIRRLLCEIGLPLIAKHIHEELPPVDIDLDALAGENPLPLFFYTKLREKIEMLREMGMTTYRFTGTQRCSYMLGRRRRSCPTQRRALQELRLFIASQAAA